MIGSLSWKHLLAIGFVLITVGVVVPFLIVLHLLPSTFLLNFLAYGSSVAGLWIGTLGAVQMYLDRRQ